MGERAYKLISLFIVVERRLGQFPEIVQRDSVGLERYNAAVFWHCFVASLGDALMVLIIAATDWIALHRCNWFERPGVSGYLVMVTAGLVLAISVEWVAVHIVGRWAYTEKMPTLPGLNVGLVPIAQMLILPPLIFRMVAVFGVRRGA